MNIHVGIEKIPTFDKKSKLVKKFDYTLYLEFDFLSKD